MLPKFGITAPQWPNLGNISHFVTLPAVKISGWIGRMSKCKGIGRSFVIQLDALSYPFSQLCCSFPKSQWGAWKRLGSIGN